MTYPTINGSLRKNINLGGVELEFNIETSGYRGGDNSVLSITLLPQPGYQHQALLHDKNRLTKNFDDFVTDNALQVSFRARGDMELDVLRGAVKEIDRSLDELLGELHAAPLSTTLYKPEIITN